MGSGGEITMHEYGLAEAILAVALEVADTHGGQAVEHLWVRFGRLRQVMPEALSLAFGAVAHGTLAEGATLHWEEVLPRVRCRSCDTIFAPEDQWFWTCPECGTADGEVLAGEDVVVTRVTLRAGENGHPRGV
jgi:hydrogenase nickel incorporation protein HypA/HybF